MPHFSTLTWRIIAFNAIALVVLTAGVILVQSSGRGLVEERLTGVQEQAAIVAGTLAEYATDPETHTLKVSRKIKARDVRGVRIKGGPGP